MKLKEFLGPLFATFVLILLGDGVVASVVLHPRGSYDWNTIAFGWALAVTFSGVLVGADNNPAITLTNAARGQLAWGKAILIVISSFIGAFLGAAVVYLCYRDGLLAAGLPNVWTSGAGSLYNADGNYMGTYSILTASITEFFATVILMWAVLAVGDKKNANIAKAAPFVIGAVILVIGLCLGGPSGYSLNPARDLAPRIFGALSGTKGLFDGWYWLIPPVLVPIVACMVGAALYDWFLDSERSLKAA